MTDPRTRIDLATFASLLVLLAFTALASLRIAADPASLDPRMLAVAFVGLGLVAAVLLGDARRLRLLLPAAPALILVGLLHLVLATTGLTGSAAASAGIGGAVQLLVGLALLPSLLTASVVEPELRSSLEELRSLQARMRGKGDLADDLGAAEEMRRLAVAWERHARAIESRLARLADRFVALRQATRPDDAVVVIPGAPHIALRRYLLGLAEAFGWSRVSDLSEVVTVPLEERQVVYVDGLRDPIAECLFLRAMAEHGPGLGVPAAPTSPARTAPGASDTVRPPWERPDRGVSRQPAPARRAPAGEPGAGVRSLADGLDRVATTLPSGEAVA